MRNHVHKKCIDRHDEYIASKILLLSTIEQHGTRLWIIFLESLESRKILIGQFCGILNLYRNKFIFRINDKIHFPSASRTPKVKATPFA